MRPIRVNRRSSLPVWNTVARVPVAPSANSGGAAPFAADNLCRASPVEVGLGTKETGRLLDRLRGASLAVPAVAGAVIHLAGGIPDLPSKLRKKSALLLSYTKYMAWWEHLYTICSAKQAKLGLFPHPARAATGARSGAGARRGRSS